METNPSRLGVLWKAAANAGLLRAAVWVTRAIAMVCQHSRDRGQRVWTPVGQQEDANPGTRLGQARLGFASVDNTRPSKHNTREANSAQLVCVKFAPGNRSARRPRHQNRRRGTQSAQWQHIDDLAPHEGHRGCLNRLAFGQLLRQLQLFSPSRATGGAAARCRLPPRLSA